MRVAPDLRTYFEKPLLNGWILRRVTRLGKADRHELEQREAGIKLRFPTWEWADWDRNRLVWAEAGCLRAARLWSTKLSTARTLYDFNPMQPPKNNA